MIIKSHLLNYMCNNILYYYKYKNQIEKSNLKNCKIQNIMKCNSMFFLFVIYLWIILKRHKLLNNKDKLLSQNFL